MEGDLAGPKIAIRFTPRRIWFVFLVAMFAVFDFSTIARVDPITKERRGYGHRELAKQWPGAFETENAYGWSRVGFNFRNIFKWWVVPPKTAKPGIAPQLAGDGNSLAYNLAGHFGGSVLLVLVALWLFRSVPLIMIVGTAVNIFHEYIAEGYYGDPSFIDLWLDQAGILFAVAVYRIITLKTRGDRSPQP